MAKCLGGGFHRLLIARGKGAEGVLHAIAELAKNNLWNIERILADEVNADAFRTNQSHHLFNFLFNGWLDVREQQMRFIKKENELWFFRIANFGKIFKQLRQHPEQKRRVNFRRLLHQLVSSKNVNDATSILRLDQVFKIQRRLTEKFVCSLRFQREQVALDRSGAGGGDISILRFKLIGVVGDVLQHRAQVLEIEKEQAVIIRDFKNHVEHARLRIV